MTKDKVYKKRIELETDRANQLALIGEMAAGLAHEIKNPLAGIQGAVDILMRRHDKGDPDYSVLEGIKREVTRINAAVNIILDRAQPRSLNVAKSSLTEVVHNAILVSQDKLDASNENRITIHFELTSDPIMLLMDAAQMEVAILELINNSIEAINDQGQISVRLWQEISTSNGSIGDAVIEVADTGQGIIQSNVSNIFNPFFTTKPNGTGLGLSAVKRIARAHDGNVEVISYPGKGTVVTLRIPLSPQR